jgi:hypothetical protein
MSKKTKALSGAAQDAYFRRLLKAHPNLPAEERDQLVRQLRQEIAQLRVRKGVPRQDGVAHINVVAPEDGVLSPAPTTATFDFDPFSPNVIVVVRTAGRDAALAALGSIDSVDHLRLLARQQKLSLDASLWSAAEIRLAIVMAAERRIANRKAAAG